MAETPQPPPPPDWPAELRAQGRSLAWLADQVGVTRSYLSEVAAGRKRASAQLAESIALHLRLAPHQRLDAARSYAAERAAWREVQALARRLADAIDEAMVVRGRGQ